MIHQHIATNDTTLHCIDHGAGPLVVLLHGFPETWWSWRHQIPELARAGYRIVAVDLRGYGDSDKRGPYGLPTTVADIIGILDHFDARRAHIVGHDWGAVLAWALAANHPDRVDRLVILNGPHPAVLKRAVLTNPRQLARMWYVLAFQFPWLGEHMLLRDNGARLVRILKANFVNRSAITDDEIEPFREALFKKGAASAMLGWYRAVFKRSLRVGRIAVPTRVIWGMQDTTLIYDALVAPLHKLVKDLDIVPIDNAGHFVHEEQPEPVTQAIVEHLRRA